MEEKLKKLEKKNKALGITLIATIILIILMLILVGITLSTLNNNGLFNKVKLAKQIYDNSIIDNNNELKNYEEQIKLATARDNIAIDSIYPIGSVYISVNDTNPSKLFGGTWKQIDKGRVLQTVNDGEISGTFVEAGLPNITGNTIGNTIPNYNEGGFNGALYCYSYGSGYGHTNPGAYNRYAIGFDASKSSSIYGNSNTVQPPAYLVYMWQRTK